MSQYDFVENYSQWIRMLGVGKCHVRVIKRLHKLHRVTGGYGDVGHEARSYLASTRLDNFG